MSRSGIFVIVVAAALFALAGAASAEDRPPVPAPADWGRALAEDAQAFHDLIADSHPGPVDKANPAFRVLLERGLATALKRARTADSYEDWYFALQAYAASFDDGHLSLHDAAPMGQVWRSDWPGFLTTRKDDAYVVAFNRDPAAPPVGAILKGCDGRSADAFAADFVGRNAGRWMLTSRRAIYAPTLFVDQHNPYARRPKACVFDIAGRTRRYPLTWRGLPDDVRGEGFTAASAPRHRAPIESRTFAGGRWIGLGSFEGNPEGRFGAKLVALKATVETSAEAIRGAPAVVFDLRGNGGGSSGWIYSLARTLWGEAWVAARQPENDAVEWRASRGNLDLIRGYKTQMGSDPEVQAWLSAVETGLAGAMARGEATWLDAASDTPPNADGPAPINLMKARAYVLTDAYCASACLDAVDLLKALGATQVGAETSADTLYMEVRDVVLPSGRMTAAIPIKVYRGRPRGSNETAKPDRVWTGRMDDTDGLERWVATIDAAR